MSGHSPLSAAPGGVRIALRVMPRSPRTRLDGLRDGRLVLRVTSPPVDGAANAAVVEAIAKALGVPKRAVTLVAGESTRNKTVEVSGVNEAEVRAALLDRL